MPVFSKNSETVLLQAHPLLQLVCRAAIKRLDFKVLCSCRNSADQWTAYKAGRSKAKPGQSAHNQTPSLAVDLFPAPYQWTDLEPFRALSRVMQDEAHKLGVPIRWGGDWNQNGCETDETLHDYPHFELHPWRSYVDKS